MAHDNNGIRITMPYVVALQMNVVIEARDKEQAKAALLRAVSINAALVTSPIQIAVDVQPAPPEMVKQLAEQLHGRKV